MKSCIAFITDYGGLDLARFATLSAALAEDASVDILLYCFDFELSKEDQLLTAFNSVQRKIAVHTITDPLHFEISEQKHVPYTSAMKILAISEACKKYSRVAYVDTDVLFMGSMDIAAIDFDEKPLAATYDIAECYGLDKYSHRADRDQRAFMRNFFNAGVMVFDASKWSDDYIQLFCDMMMRHTDKCDYKLNCSSIDQCVWNMLFQARWKRLPINYNFQACGMFSRQWDEAQIRHYVGKKKFWPLNPFRNDKKDIALITKIAKLLGTSCETRFYFPLARRMNVYRNAKATKNVDLAIQYVEQLRAEYQKRVIVEK